MPEIKYVAIAAVSEEPSSTLIKNTEEFLEKIAPFKKTIRIILGGYWGLMRVIADKAAEKGFIVIFTLPENPPVMPPRRKEFIPIITDLGFQSRSTVMCRTCDVLVAMGGRIGSILEVLLAYDYGKPSVVVRSGYDTDKLEKCFPGYVDKRRKAPIYYVGSGFEAAEKVLELLGITM